MGGPRRDRLREARQLALELFEAGACFRAYRHDRRALKKRTGDELLNLQLREFQDFAVHQVRFRQSDEPVADADKICDVEVLAGLRLDGFVGGDDQQHQVHASHACQHVLHEPLVAGDVNEPNAQPAAKIEVGEPQVYGDAAPLFLFQAVGIHPRQRLDQRRLPMVNVPRRPYDHVFHVFRVVDRLILSDRVCDGHFTSG